MPINPNDISFSQSWLRSFYTRGPSAVVDNRWIVEQRYDPHSQPHNRHVLDIIDLQTSEKRSAVFTTGYGSGCLDIAMLGGDKVGVLNGEYIHSISFGTKKQFEAATKKVREDLRYSYNVGSVSIFDAKQGKMEGQLAIGSNVMSICHLSANRFVSVHDLGSLGLEEVSEFAQSIKVWDLNDPANPRCLHTFEVEFPLDKNSTKIEFKSLNNKIYVFSKHDIAIFDPDKNPNKASTILHTSIEKAFSAHALLQNGQLIVAYAGGDINFYDKDLDKKIELKIPDSHSNSWNQLQLIANEKYLLCWDYRPENSAEIGKLQVWDIANTKIVEVSCLKNQLSEAYQSQVEVRPISEMHLLENNKALIFSNSSDGRYDSPCIGVTDLSKLKTLQNHQIAIQSLPTSSSSMPEIKTDSVTHSQSPHGIFSASMSPGSTSPSTEHPNDALNNGLLSATHKGDLSEIKRLVAHGAAPGFVERHTFMGKIYSSTPFHNLLWTARKNLELHKPAIDYFLNDLKIDINQTDFDGNTPAHILSTDEGVEVMRYLLPQGLDLLKANNRGEYPINKALSPNHNFKAVEFLVRNMTSIPLDIARRLIELNHLKNDEYSQMVATKSGKSNLLDELKAESDKINERNKKYREDRIANQIMFFDKCMREKIRLRKSHDELISQISSLPLDKLLSLKSTVDRDIEANDSSIQSYIQSMNISEMNINKYLSKGYSDDSEEENYLMNMRVLKDKYDLEKTKSEFNKSALIAVEQRIKCITESHSSCPDEYKANSAMKKR